MKCQYWQQWVSRGISIIFLLRRNTLSNKKKGFGTRISLTLGWVPDQWNKWKFLSGFMHWRVRERYLRARATDLDSENAVLEKLLMCIGVIFPLFILLPWIEMFFPFKSLIGESLTRVLGFGWLYLHTCIGIIRVTDFALIFSKCKFN